MTAAALAAPLLLAGAGSAAADPDPARRGARLAARLVAAGDAEEAHDTLAALQRIADRNGGTRVAGSKGHDQSAQYVYEQARRAGLKVSKQEFEYTFFDALSQRLDVVSPKAEPVPVVAMTYSVSGPEAGLTAELAAAPVGAATGCAATDYPAGAFTGRIALIRRGGCSFAQKQAAAGAAGAAGAIIYNNTDGDLNGTLGDPTAGKVPTGGITKAAGEALAAEAAAGPVRVTLDIRTRMEPRKTWNVLAETRGGDPADTVMVGAHLDSVPAGPGINDNGSGSAGILEVARHLGTHPVKNKVRFAWWSAEEFGLKGSEAYVNSLSETDRKNIRLYLNFDMIASPNYAQFVYDGSGSTGGGAGPEGSAQIERDITGYLDGRGLPHDLSAFNGRSDYGPFIDAGIPAGGTDTGAEVIKSPEQAARYGGTAGTAFDACYHKACDDLGNIDMAAFDVNIDVIAHAVGTYAWDLSSLQRPVPAQPPARKAPAAAGASGSGTGGASSTGADGHAHGVTA
ncbi:M28 family metallopeptidase [Streptomyces sp. NRRL S-350]|uniref:M28 family metallopeptidase n=1 Tax=Streptomyces sp. NRRL S-350 TaxID=1463902 RepID=UPI000D13FECE|nr:M28 family metallopeptidase [Streptomyces sp. NRRL S-350]